MDCVVKSWIFSTISTDLVEAVMARDATARDIWLTLKNLGNKETRALHLDTKFRHFCQGDLSITDYADASRTWRTLSATSVGTAHWCSMSSVASLSVSRPSGVFCASPGTSLRSWRFSRP
jgi:hypothetical protein